MGLNQFDHTSNISSHTTFSGISDYQRLEPNIGLEDMFLLSVLSRLPSLGSSNDTSQAAEWPYIGRPPTDPYRNMEIYGL